MSDDVEEIPPVYESDEEPPETVVRECPESGETVEMSNPVVAPVTATTGAWGKYVAYWYACAECGKRHQFQYSQDPTRSSKRFGSNVSPTVERAARRLADPGLLTYRQALAWVLRDVEDVGREDAAHQLGLSPSTLDNHLGAARRKIRRARATIEDVDELTGDDE